MRKMIHKSEIWRARESPGLGHVRGTQTTITMAITIAMFARFDDLIRYINYKPVLVQSGHVVHLSNALSKYKLYAYICTYILVLELQNCTLDKMKSLDTWLFDLNKFSYFDNGANKNPLMNCQKVVAQDRK